MLTKGNGDQGIDLRVGDASQSKSTAPDSQSGIVEASILELQKLIKTKKVNLYKLEVPLDPPTILGKLKKMIASENYWKWKKKFEKS